MLQMGAAEISASQVPPRFFSPSSFLDNFKLLHSDDSHVTLDHQLSGYFNFLVFIICNEIIAFRSVIHFEDYFVGNDLIGIVDLTDDSDIGSQ
jgi:hypothetical protein